jgi:hypothetical protein
MKRAMTSFRLRKRDYSNEGLTITNNENLDVYHFPLYTTAFQYRARCEPDCVKPRRRSITPMR